MNKEFNNDLNFDLKCGKCKTSDVGLIYFNHPVYGFVCELCPEFEDGMIYHYSDHTITNLDDIKKNNPYYLGEF